MIFYRYWEFHVSVDKLYSFGNIDPVRNYLCVCINDTHTEVDRASSRPPPSSTSHAHELNKNRANKTWDQPERECKSNILCKTHDECFYYVGRQSYERYVVEF